MPAPAAGGLTIRVAQAADAALVFAFVREFAASEHLSLAVDADQDMLAEALFGAHPRVFCDIAEWTEPNGVIEPAGFAVWHYNFSTFRGRHGIYLEDLYVREAFRRRGIGVALLRHLARRCVREGLARFEWRVLHWNPAVAFYRAQGADILDEWKVCRVTGAALDRLGAGAREPTGAATGKS